MKFQLINVIFLITFVISDYVTAEIIKKIETIEQSFNQQEAKLNLLNQTLLNIADVESQIENQIEELIHKQSDLKNNTYLDDFKTEMNNTINNIVVQKIEEFKQTYFKDSASQTLQVNSKINNHQQSHIQSLPQMGIKSNHQQFKQVNDQLLHQSNQNDQDQVPEQSSQQDAFTFKTAVQSSQILKDSPINHQKSDGLITPIYLQKEDINKVKGFYIGTFGQDQVQQSQEKKDKNLSQKFQDQLKDMKREKLSNDQIKKLIELQNTILHKNTKSLADFENNYEYGQLKKNHNQLLDQVKTKVVYTSNLKNKIKADLEEQRQKDQILNQQLQQQKQVLTQQQQIQQQKENSQTELQLKHQKLEQEIRSLKSQQSQQQQQFQKKQDKNDNILLSKVTVIPQNVFSNIFEHNNKEERIVQDQIKQGYHLIKQDFKNKIKQNIKPQQGIHIFDQRLVCKNLIGAQKKD